jgi:hypothetical protein
MFSRGTRLGLLVLTVAVGLLALAAGSAWASAAAPTGAVPKCQHPAPKDAHNRWEVVFGVEPTLAKAERVKARAIAQGFTKVGIETECIGYSVANAGFKSRATALVMVKQAQAKGFPDAHTEDS